MPTILYTHEILASHLRKAHGAYVFEQRTEKWSIYCLRIGKKKKTVRVSRLVFFVSYYRGAIINGEPFTHGGYEQSRGSYSRITT